MSTFLHVSIRPLFCFLSLFSFLIPTQHLLNVSIQIANTEVWEPSMGTSHRLPNQYWGNGYPKWYQSNNSINRITVVTNNHNNIGNVYERFLYWVRLRTSTELYLGDASMIDWPSVVTWLWHWLHFGLDHPIPEGYIYMVLSLQVMGGLEYLHRCPASRKRRRKGNPVPGGITGPPCSRGI
jgi:hypothetical protein